MNLHYNTIVSNTTKMARKIEAQRRVAQSMNQNEYEQALIKLKEKIRLTEGTDMQEHMEEQIRQWFIECRYCDFCLLQIRTRNFTELNLLKSYLSKDVYSANCLLIREA